MRELSLVCALLFLLSLLLFAFCCSLEHGLLKCSSSQLATAIPTSASQRGHFSAQASRGSNWFSCIYCDVSLPFRWEAAVRSAQEGREEAMQHKEEVCERPTHSVCPSSPHGLGSLHGETSVCHRSIMAGYHVSFMDAGFAFSLYTRTAATGTLPSFASFTEELTAQGTGPEGRSLWSPVNSTVPPTLPCP